MSTLRLFLLKAIGGIEKAKINKEDKGLL